MKYLIILPMLVAGCYPNSIGSTIPAVGGPQNTPPVIDSNGKNSFAIDLNNKQDIVKYDSDTNFHRVVFGEKNWVDFTLFQTRATIKGYASEFEYGARALFSQNHEKKITNLKELQEFCHENFYETNSDFIGLTGQLIFTANPLHWSFFQSNAGRLLKELITEVENPFVISKKQVNIITNFLSNEDKVMIINSGFLEYFDTLDALRLNLFNSLVGPKEYLSSRLARLFCGIADNKASILYTFYNDKGESLRVRINSIIFKDQNY